MSDDNAIVSCVTLTGAEYVTMLAEAQQLKKDNERLRAALQRLACTCDRVGNAECSSGEVDCPFWQARAALEEGRT